MTEHRKRKTGNSTPGAARWLLCGVLWLLCSFFGFQSWALAEGIDVRKAEAHYADGSYQLSADFNIGLNAVVDQALSGGIPLYFVSEFTLTRPRWYWLDEEVSQSEQTIKLSYNVLTKQYRITRGSLFRNFSSLDDALRVIAHQSAPPIPADLLKVSTNYIATRLLRRDNTFVAAARLRLDVTQLPKPLQVNALTGKDWNLDSGWHTWAVRADAGGPVKAE